MGHEVLTLEPGDDHVFRLAHRSDPVRAVIELIWNSLDAEAYDVRVEFRRGDLGAIEEVSVIDDGHGISPDEGRTTFGTIGNSWKRPGQKTKNGHRLLHGKRGEGRLRAFALGDTVEWDSFAEDTAGVLHRVRITGDSNNVRSFPSSFDPVTTATKTGTRFIACNRGQLTLVALESEKARMTLLEHFAPTLLDEPGLSLVYDKTKLDPEEHMVEDKTYDLTDVEGNAKLRIIEWQSAVRGTSRSLHVGRDGTHFPYVESATQLEGGFPFSAYASWDRLGHEELRLFGLHEMGGDVVAPLWKAIERKVRDHFAARRRRERRQQIRKWKEMGVYPYEGNPSNDAEKAERALFDALGVTLAQQIASEKQQAKVTLQLLQGAVRHDRGTLTKILNEVLSLSPEDVATLTRLLNETTLSSIIGATSMVADRFKVLEGLKYILFDPQGAKRVGERTHLHPILNGELWVFGEGYSVMRSEKSLTDLARTHLQLAGLPDETATVVRHDGRTGRTDLHLAVCDQQHDRIRHLVVELKAPHVKLGRKELDQVEDYANTVVDTPAFANGRSDWDFILVGTTLDDIVRRRLIAHRDDGLFWRNADQGKPRVRAFVRTWSEILTENKQRLNFLSRGLALDPSVKDGLRHLQAMYADRLPPDIALREGAATSA